MSSTFAYPADLPAPQTWQETPVERRALAGMDTAAPGSARALQRDYAATAQATWVYTAAQFAQWRDWWLSDLVYGGAWFTADGWPTPRGRGCVLRFQGAPTVSHLGRGLRQVSAVLDVRGATEAPAWRPSFAGMLASLYANLQPMSDTVQTPRWLPDSSGTQWFVRPLATMATNTVDSTVTPSNDRRFTALDEDAADYDAGDSGTWTTFFNHPLGAASGSIRVRDANPIDPASVVAVGYPNKTWTGSPTTMATEVLLDTTTTPGTDLYYIRSSGGPGFVDPLDSEFKGTADITYRYADLAVLDGTTYAKAWPGLRAVDWSAISPGDTLWVCGTHEGQTLTVGASGTAGNYIKIRFDYPSDPGTINKALEITSAWTASGSEYWTSYPDISEAMMFEDGERLIGVNSRSRCRTQVPHELRNGVPGIDWANNTISFTQIRRIQTGDPIDIPSDFQWQLTLPLGLEGATRYYAIVDNCTGWVGTDPVTKTGGTPGTWQYYSVSTWLYTVRLAASYADAIAGTEINLTALRSDPDDPPQEFFLIYVTQPTSPFFDPQPGALEPGEYAVDIVAKRLYYRPTTGVPGDHELRIAAETFAAAGACIYGTGVDYIRILGGGEYGGLFGVAPVGRIGLSHMNAIEFDTCSDIVVDGMHIEGTRSAVAFVDTPNGTVRNCRIAHCAHHGSGGEDLAGTQEPDQILERNWFSDIGQGHDFGDAQACVTNPLCHRTVFRRNYCQRIGRNEKVSNPATVVYDSSTDVVTYLNWMDDCHGKAVEMDGGNGEAGVQAGYVVANICTRQGQGLDPTANLVQRVGFLHMNLNGPTDKGVAGIQVFGNLVAFASIGNRAPDTLDDCGAIYQRTNNNDGTYDGSTPSANQISNLTRNVFLGITDGPVFARQKNTNATSAPWPTTTTDRNVFASVEQLGQETTSGTPVDSWTTLADWQETGRDLTSVAVSRAAGETRTSAPTVGELEILRLYDDYDTLDLPTVAIIGQWPFNES